MKRAVRAAYPEAEIVSLPQSESLQARLDALRFSVDALRALYVGMRAGQLPDRTDPRAEAMVQVLQRLELIGPQLQLLPMRKCDPESDPLYRMIQGCDL